MSISRSVNSNVTLPLITRSGGRIAAAIVLISVDLPQLDSPARP
jgi:hypothetical protein